MGATVDYGAVTVEAAIAGDGPRATLVLANPLPAAGLREVRVGLAPTPEGFRIETSGQSMLGPFDGLVNLSMPSGGPIRIGIERLDVAQTSVSGDLTLGDGAVAGTLALAGGGLDGTIALAERSAAGFQSISRRRAVFPATPLRSTMRRFRRSGLSARR